MYEKYCVLISIVICVIGIRYVWKSAFIYEYVFLYNCGHYKVDRVNAIETSSTVIVSTRGSTVFNKNSWIISNSSGCRAFDYAIGNNSLFERSNHSLGAAELSSLSHHKVVRIEDIVRKLNSERVLVTFTNYGFMEAFYSCYVTNQLWKYSNFFVVAIDRKTYETLSQQHIPVALLKTSFVADKKADFRGNSFNIIMRIKLYIIRRILSMGVNCLMFDADIVFFQNPYIGIDSDPDYDMIVQQDEYICAGFMFMRSCSNSIQLIDKSLISMTDRGGDDQQNILTVINRNMIHGLRWKFLPSWSYNKGSIFFKSHQFYWDPISPNVVMAHNNYVIRVVNKDYRLKELGLYPLDVNGEYSNLSEKYVVLENFLLENGPITLEQLVTLANALDRHIVLPAFPCHWTMRHKGECNLCGYHPVRCHYSIMSKCKLSWKEHVFFSNRNVPTEIREAYRTAPLIVFVQNDYECNEKKRYLGNSINCVIFVPNKPIINKSIKSLFGNIRNVSVIRIHSIPFDLSCTSEQVRCSETKNVHDLFFTYE